MATERSKMQTYPYENVEAYYLNVYYDKTSVASTHLVNDGHFLLLAQFFVDHVHLRRTHYSLSERNDGLGRTDFNFSKPTKRQVKILLITYVVMSDITSVVFWCLEYNVLLL